VSPTVKIGEIGSVFDDVMGRLFVWG